MSKSIFILLLCIAIGVSLVAVVAGAVLFWRKRRREQVFAVADGNILFFQMLYTCLDLLNFENINLNKGLTGSCLTLQMRILVLHTLGSSSFIFLFTCLPSLHKEFV